MTQEASEFDPHPVCPATGASGAAFGVAGMASHRGRRLLGQYSALWLGPEWRGRPLRLVEMMRSSAGPLTVDDR
jgi:hypothetical protein